MAITRAINTPTIQERSKWWVRLVCVGLFLIAGFFVVGHWRNNDSVALLLVWLPVLYGLATLISKRDQIVEEFRATPLWFAVSQLRGDEVVGGFIDKYVWKDELAKIHAGREYAENPVYYLPIDTGVLYDFGLRLNVLKLERYEAEVLAKKCREYLRASRQCRRYFALGWMGAVALPFVANLQQNEILLAIASSVVVLWGVTPRWSMPDRTKDSQFLCPKHIHIYSYCPASEEGDGHYECVCGKKEIARDPTDSS